MRTIMLASIAALLMASAVDAQTAATTTTPAAKSTTKTTKAMKPAASTTAMSSSASSSTPAKASGRKPQTAESKACSAQADAKNLHGKDRQKFRRGCMKGAA